MTKNRQPFLKIQYGKLRVAACGWVAIAALTVVLWKIF